MRARGYSIVQLLTEKPVDTFSTAVEDLCNDNFCNWQMKPFDYSKELAPVATAVLLERMDDLVLLVKEGADINAQDECGRSALIMAMDQDLANTDWIEFLVANGIDVNLQDNNGDTALDLARNNGNEEAIASLLKHNALGKAGPSAKEQQWDQIYDAFDQADQIKFAYRDAQKKIRKQD